MHAIASQRGSLQTVGLLVMVLTLAVALPAAAGSGGAGTYEGEEKGNVYEDDPPENCIKVLESVYWTTNAGNDNSAYSDYHSDDAGITFDNDGTTEGFYLEFVNTSDYYINPDGTFMDRVDGECQGDPGAEVPAEFELHRMNGLDHGTETHYIYSSADSSEPCTGTGTFSRDEGRIDNNFHADWTLDEDCTVAVETSRGWQTATAPAGTSHTFRGTLEPCVSGVCPDPQLYGDFDQILPN